MISYSELRIGNRILTSRGAIIMVCNINNDGRINKGYSHTPELASCNGIPMTENLLLKCGFETMGGYLELTINHEKELTIYQGDKNSIVEAVFDCNGFELFRCKYLHQLQNLYWCLTGTELTVKL